MNGYEKSYALVILLTMLCHGGCSCQTRHGQQEHGLAHAVPSDVYPVNSRLMSIETWRVSLAGGSADDLVAVFRHGGWISPSGFVIWRKGKQVLGNYPLVGVPYGWNQKTVLDLSQGTAVPAHVLDELLGLQEGLQALPKESPEAYDDNEYFIYIKRGNTVRKYRTRSSIMTEPGVPQGFWNRFYDTTHDFWSDPE